MKPNRGLFSAIILGLLALTLAIGCTTNRGFRPINKKKGADGTVTPPQQPIPVAVPQDIEIDSKGLQEAFEKSVSKVVEELRNLCTPEARGPVCGTLNGPPTVVEMDVAEVVSGTGAGSPSSDLTRVVRGVNTDLSQARNVYSSMIGGLSLDTYSNSESGSSSFSYAINAFIRIDQQTYDLKASIDSGNTGSNFVISRVRPLSTNCNSLETESRSDLTSRMSESVSFHLLCSDGSCPEDGVALKLIVTLKPLNSERPVVVTLEYGEGGGILGLVGPPEFVDIGNHNYFTYLEFIVTSGLRYCNFSDSGSSSGPETFDSGEETVSVAKRSAHSPEEDKRDTDGQSKLQELKELERTVKSNKVRVDSLDRSLEGINNQISTISDKLVKAQSTASVLKGQHAVADTAYRKKLEEFKAMRTGLNHFYKRQEVGAEVRRLNDHRHEKIQEKNTAEEKVKTLDEGLNELNAQAETVQEELTKARENLKKSQQAYEDLQTAIENSVPPRA